MDSYEGEDRGRCDQAHRPGSDTFVHIEKQTMLIASVRGFILHVVVRRVFGHFSEDDDLRLDAGTGGRGGDLYADRPIDRVSERTSRVSLTTKVVIPPCASTTCILFAFRPRLPSNYQIVSKSRIDIRECFGAQAYRRCDSLGDGSSTRQTSRRKLSDERNLRGCTGRVGLSWSQEESG